MRRSAFSLVELMIVVAIIGILAAIAIPNFQVMQLKAKKAEARPMMNGIAVAEVAYQTQNDRWVEASTNPGTSLTKALRAWDPSKAGWSSLGFKPDGMVRCNYSVNCQGGSGGSCTDRTTYVRVGATCDVDDDNSTATIYYYVDNNVAGCCGSQAPGTFVESNPNRY